MSRVGKKPIQIPSGVEVSVSGQLVNVKGPKGEMQLHVHPLVGVAVEEAHEGKQLVATAKPSEDREQNAQWGTARALLSNMIEGVSKGFSKKLEINGVGYRVNVQGSTIVLNLGFSHDVRIPLPQGLQASAEANVLTLTGFDKHLVGETAARIRAIRKPEPYKGKGIKYSDEVIRRKAGKAQKSGE